MMNTELIYYETQGHWVVGVRELARYYSIMISHYGLEVQTTRISRSNTRQAVIDKASAMLRSWAEEK